MTHTPPPADTQPPTRRKFWRWALMGVLAVSLAGCGGPSAHSNAMVVHIVAAACAPTDHGGPMLVVEVVSGRWGKATTTEWHLMRQLDGCGEPIAGHPWRGSVLQAWVSDYHWRAGQQMRVQMGHRADDKNMWAVGDALRVDWDHMFLGTVDVGSGDSQPEFVPPGGVDTVVALLDDRQSCGPGPERRAGCDVDDWEHADPFTFVAQDRPAPDAPADTVSLVVPMPG